MSKRPEKLIGEKTADYRKRIQQWNQNRALTKGARKEDKKETRQMGRRTERQTGRRNERQNDRRTIRQTDRRTERQTGRRTDRKTQRVTDRKNDRAVQNAKERAQKRTQMKQDFNNQNINTASDFNYDQHNRKGSKGTHVSGAEARHVQKATKGTESRRERVNNAVASLQAQKDSGAEMSDRASARLKALQVKKGNMSERQTNKTNPQNPTDTPQNPETPKNPLPTTPTPTTPTPTPTTPTPTTPTPTTPTPTTPTPTPAPTPTLPPTYEDNDGIDNDGDDNVIGDDNVDVGGNDNVVGDDNIVIPGKDNIVGDDNIDIGGDNNGIISPGNDNINVDGPNKGIINDGNKNEFAWDTGNIKIDNTIKHGNQELQGNQTVGDVGDYANVDMSNRQYGGDSRTLVINNSNTGTGGENYGGYFNLGDQAVTMGTLGGFWDADDSPAGQAKFVDMQSTMNRDNQKRYAGRGLAIAAQLQGYRGGDVNRLGLDYATKNMSNKFFDMATDAEAKTFGDRWHYTNKAKGVKFRFGDPIEEVTSEAADIAKDYEDDLD